MPGKTGAHLSGNRDWFADSPYTGGTAGVLPEPILGGTRSPLTRRSAAGKLTRGEDVQVIGPSGPSGAVCTVAPAAWASRSGVPAALSAKLS